MRRPDPSEIRPHPTPAGHRQARPTSARPKAYFRSNSTRPFGRLDAQRRGGARLQGLDGVQGTPSAPSTFQLPPEGQPRRSRSFLSVGGVDDLLAQVLRPRHLRKQETFETDWSPEVGVRKAIIGAHTRVNSIASARSIETGQSPFILPILGDVPAPRSPRFSPFGRTRKTFESGSSAEPKTAPRISVHSIESDLGPSMSAHSIASSIRSGSKRVLGRLSSFTTGAGEDKPPPPPLYPPPPPSSKGLEEDFLRKSETTASSVVSGQGRQSSVRMSIRSEQSVRSLKEEGAEVPAEHEIAPQLNPLWEQRAPAKERYDGDEEAKRVSFDSAYNWTESLHELPSPGETLELSGKPSIDSKASKETEPSVREER